MVAKTDRERAEACFAVARSTTHEGERAAAIGRGTAICEKHGLDLDGFDIPGRAKARQAGPGRVDWSSLYEDRTVRPGPQFRDPYADVWTTAGAAYRRPTDVDLDEAIRRHRAHMADTEFARMFREGVDEAIERSRADIRAQQERNREAARRAELRRQWPTERAAVDFLFARGVPVYDLGEDVDPRWFAPTIAGTAMDEWELRELAQRNLAP